MVKSADAGCCLFLLLKRYGGTYGMNSNTGRRCHYGCSRIEEQVSPIRPDEGSNSGVIRSAYRTGAAVFLAVLHDKA